MNILEISTLLVEKWRTKKINAGCKPISANRDVTALKACLSKAVEWGIIDLHPLHNLKPYKVDNNIKVRFLSNEEEKMLRHELDQREEVLRNNRNAGNHWRSKRNYSLLPDLDPLKFADHIKPIVLLSLNTGLRRGELFNLIWQNVDLQFASLTVAGEFAKSGKTRHIPLNKEALEILKKWRNQTTSRSLVFPSHDDTPFTNVTKAWMGVLKSRYQKFRWHDLRHHFASRLVMAKVDLNTVRELLGHSDVQMTLRYAHLAPEHKAQAVAKLITDYSY